MPGEKSLQLCDNLNGQVAEKFVKAVAEHAPGSLRFGPKKATHVWQPVDHHVGAAYHYKMGCCYDELMATFNERKISAPEIRILLTKWAGRAFQELEAEREKREAACAALEAAGEPVPAEARSLFYRAFLRTGCLVTADGTGDEEIKPHREIKGEVEVNFRSILSTHRAARPRDDDDLDAPFIIEVSESDEESEDEGDEGDVGDEDGPPDTEDDDDESAEEGSDKEQEVVGDNEQWVVDEQDLIAQARAEADELGDFEARDFSLAARVAREIGFALEPEWAVAAPAPAPADGCRRSSRSRRVRK